MKFLFRNKFFNQYEVEKKIRKIITFKFKLSGFVFLIF